MRKFGLKLWSSNENYAKIAGELYDKGLYDYIELYALPDTYNDTIKFWDCLKNIPFKIHAPHFMQGVNFSLADKRDENFRLIHDSFLFADKLNADIIIFHPGIAGDYKQSAIQMSAIKDSRATLENKPYNIEISAVSHLKSTDTCVGAKYMEVKYILDNSNIKFCLDIGHAISASNGLKLDPYGELIKFIALKPSLYHLSDGNIDSNIDKHYHIGSGSYDFVKIFSMIDKNIPITIETNKDSRDNLDDFIADVTKLRDYN